MTPECVVDRLRRNNVYIWLLKRIYSQHKCQFMQDTFGNTGQRMDSIRISECWPCIYNPNSSILIWNLENCSRCKNILVPYFFYFQHQKLMTFFATGNCALSIFCKFKKLREFIIENWNNCSKRSERLHFPKGGKWNQVELFDIINSQITSPFFILLYFIVQ